MAAGSDGLPSLASLKLAGKLPERRGKAAAPLGREAIAVGDHVAWLLLVQASLDNYGESLRDPKNVRTSINQGFAASAQAESPVCRRRTSRSLFMHSFT